VTPDAASDGDLATRAAGGDERAFNALMHRHREGVYRFAHRYVGDADAAYEVVQETFVSAWRALRRYDPARPFAVWLRAIAVNKCRDRARRAAVQRLLFGGRTADLADVSDVGDRSWDTEASLIAAQRATAVDRAVSELPPQLKEPLLLTVFDGLSQAQAAQTLGISVKAVETRVRRAKQRLSRALV